MYGGLDKGGGGVVGSAESQLISVEFSDVAETTSAEEILICEEVVVVGEEGEEVTRKVYAEAALNPKNGDLVWMRSYDEAVILNRTIAMSQMTSMLHDLDRNAVYERAIQRMIASFITKYDRNPTVLDIGTGTGLLAMMCVRHGAEFVIGCEMFEAMAEVARRVVDQNGYSDKILIVTAKSCDIDSLPFSPDLIISELLDSALLGEGVIFSHRDAIDRFLERSLPNDNIADRVIPHSAVMYGTLIQSTELSHLCSVSDSLSADGLSSRRKTGWSDAEADSYCPWSRMIPVHWQQRFEASSVKLSEPAPLLNVEFFHGSSQEAEEQLEQVSQCRMTVLQNGVIHGLLCWWNLSLISPELRQSVSDQISFTYSTSPGTQRWQDHWQQVVFPFPGAGISCREGDVLLISTFHNDLQIWCQVEFLQRGDMILHPPDYLDPTSDREEHSKKKQKLECSSSHPPECSCGWHILCGCDRILSLNDSSRMEAWRVGIRTLMKGIMDARTSKDSACVICDLSDGSILSLMAASHLSTLTEEQQDHVRIFSVERKELSSLFHSQLVQSNQERIGDLFQIISGEEWQESLDEEETAIQGPFAKLLRESFDPLPQQSIAAVISECFSYQMAASPVMTALSFFYCLHDISVRNRSCPNPTLLRVAPLRARVMTAGFQLDELRVSHGEAGIVSGFNHSSLDEIQESWEENWFPYKLGNYRKRILTEPLCVATIDYGLLTVAGDDGNGDAVLCSPPHQRLHVISPGQLDCMALWVEYEAAESIRVETWDGVNFPPYLTTPTRFFKEPLKISSPESCPAIFCDSRFTFGDSSIGIECSTVSEAVYSR